MSRDNKYLLNDLVSSSVSNHEEDNQGHGEGDGKRAHNYNHNFRLLGLSANCIQCCTNALIQSIINILVTYCSCNRSQGQIQCDYSRGHK